MNRPPDDATAGTASSANWWRQPWWVALALAAGAVALVSHALAYGFVCDDAYISFRYSFNLARHGELVFNLGERVEGYTNFLWTVLLAGLLKLGLRPEVMSLVLGALAGVAVLLLLYALSRAYRSARGEPASAWDLVGALLLPTWGSFAVWCSGGLETQLFTALALLGVLLYAREQAARRADDHAASRSSRWPWSGVVFALATMTRPEGLLLFGLTGLHRVAANLIGERRLLPTRAELIWVAGYLLPFGLFVAWRYGYYGHPLPNTFYVKSGGGWQMVERWGLPYLWDFVHHNRLYVLPALLAVPALRRWPTRRPAADDRPSRPGLSSAFLFSYVGLICLAYVVYVTWVGGDFMTMGRFFVPIVPLLALVAQESVRATACRFRRPLLVGGPLVGLLLAGGVVNSVWLHRQNQQMSYHRWGLDTIAYLKKFADDRVIIGTWMRRHLPADTFYSVAGAGSSCYTSRLKALDALGLSDEWIAHNVPAAKGGRPAHSKFAPLSYALRREVDLMCHIGKHQDWLYRPSRNEAAAWRARGYRWVCLAPEGVRPRYYCCLKRIERDLGPHLIEVDP